MVFRATQVGAHWRPRNLETPEPTLARGFLASRETRCMSVMATEQVNALVTATDAACLAGVASATIRTWVDRGILPVAEKDERGRNMFRLIDVVRAERSTRDRARRVYATA